MITKEQLHHAMPRATVDNITRYVEPFQQTMEKYFITTPLRMAHFVSQLAHESLELKHVSENLNYSKAGLIATFPKYFKDPALAASLEHKPEAIANLVYGNRMGNVDAGDGWRFRGRGLIGITGKTNYVNLSKETGIPCVAQPELLEGAECAVLSAGWFWNKYLINAMADADDVVAVTKRINGGLIGLQSRKEYLKLAKQTFKLQ